MMNDIERRQRIYQEWIEEAKRIDPRKRPDEFSLREFAKNAGIGRELAAAILEQKVKEGLAIKRETSKGVYYSLA